MSAQFGNFAVLALTCVVGTIALLLGTLILAYASRRKHDALGMSRGEAFAMAVVFLICGLGITYISLVAIGHAPLASTLPHWTPANFHPIRGVTTVDVWSWAHYSIAGAIVAVRTPRESDEQYEQRVNYDVQEALATHSDINSLSIALQTLSPDAYVMLGAAYIENGTPDASTIHELERAGMWDDGAEGGLNAFGRHVAAYNLYKGRARLLAALMGSEHYM